MLSSLCRRPLVATLFPYTTLFRSADDDDSCRLLATRRARLSLRTRALACDEHLAVALLYRPAGQRTQRGSAQRLAGAQVEADRKSTRLNSSHLGISYAVFCLKKKK